MGGAMLSKSLIQFSGDGWGCVSFLLFDLGPNSGGGKEDNGDLFLRAHACTTVLSVPSPAAGQPQPTPLPETPGHSCESLGQCLVGSLLLLFVPSKSLFPQSCVSSGASMVGLMATSSKRAYAIPRSTAPRVPVPAAVHC